MRARNWFLVFLALLIVPSTSGDGLYRDIYRGLQFFVTPTGGPVFPTGDGSVANGARSGRVRYMPNELGEGWRIELDRSFGGDSRGRLEVYDLGAADLTLQGAVNATAGYTSRGFFIGNLDFNVSNLSYLLRGKTGAQDATLTGTLNVQNQLEINQFGFYDLQMQIDHTNANLTIDGVLVNESDQPNFNVGPITVSGNIFFDGFVALLRSVGADTSGLEALSPDSPTDRINDAISEQLRDTFLVAGFQFDERALDEALDTALTLRPTDWLAAYGADGRPQTAPGREQSLVPEPSTLALLALCAATCCRRRPRSP